MTLSYLYAKILYKGVIKMKLNALEKSKFNSAVKRINEQLRVSKLKGWEGLTDDIQNFLLPYQTTEKGNLSQSIKYYDQYDIDKIIKYSHGEFYIPKHKEELIENFGDLGEEKLKEYSSTLPRYKEKFNEYISQYYSLMLDKFSTVLFEKEKISYPQLYEMVDYVDNHKHPSQRNITLQE